MHFSKTAVVLAILPFAIADTCSSSSATLYGSGSGSSTPQSEIDAAFTQCTSGCSTTDASCLTGCLDDACTTYCGGSSTGSCHETCLADPCSAFYGSGSATPDPTALAACYKAANPQTTVEARSLSKRALDCTSSETCYKEANGNLFCLNESTGNYHDIEGGTGNVNTGAYTSGTGSMATSTPAAASSTPAATRTNAGTSTAATSAPAATSAAGNSGDKLQANAMAGTLAFVLGLFAL